MIDTTDDKKEKCYFCPEDFKEEVGRFYVEMEGKIRLMHRKCWTRHKAGQSLYVMVGFNGRLVVK